MEQLFQVAEVGLQAILAVLFVLTPGLVFWLVVVGLAVVVRRIRQSIPQAMRMRKREPALS
jgi:hypothetical protein